MTPFTREDFLKAARCIPFATNEAGHDEIAKLLIYAADLVTLRDGVEQLRDDAARRERIGQMNISTAVVLWNFDAILVPPAPTDRKGLEP